MVVTREDKILDLGFVIIRPARTQHRVDQSIRGTQPDCSSVRYAQDPVVSLQLTGVDVETILEQASYVDNTGARRAKIRELIFESLEIEDDNGLFAATRSWIWRGGRRKADPVRQHPRRNRHPE